MTDHDCQNGAISCIVVCLVMNFGIVQPVWSQNSDNSPALVVGEIEIIRTNVFSEAEIDSTVGILAFVQKTTNSLHMKTREYVVRNELLFSEGDVYRPQLLEETKRNLRDLGFMNDIRVTAVDTTADGRVRVRVEVRDSWSLKSNLTYTRSASGDTRWNISLSEVNFLGQALTMGVGLGGDENSTFQNFWFRKRRLTGADLEVGLNYSQRNDGHNRSVSIRRPFYSLGDKWSLEAQAWDSLNDVRFFLSNAGQAGFNSRVGTSLYALLPMSQQGFQIISMLRLSPAEEGRVWRLGAGLQISERFLDVGQQSSWVLSDERETDLRFLTETGQPLAREQGTTVYPFLWLRTQGRTWTESRFVLQFGPMEDIPLDWNLSLKAGPTGPEIGSTTGFGGSTWRAEAVATKWFNFGPGLLMVQGSGTGQTGKMENRYHRINVQSGWLAAFGAEHSPWQTRVVAEAGHGSRLPGDTALVLGLYRGLRTLDFDGMAGDRLVRWNFEQGKVLPWEVLDMAHVGLAAFYSGGCAWWNDEDRDLKDSRHEAGVGLRVGPTRSANAMTSKLDLSWDLDGSRGPVFTATTHGFF